MKPENQKILDDNQHHHDFYKRTETLPGGMHGISHHQLKELERVMREEFVEGYTADLTGCGPCIVNHLIWVYQEYDKWKKRQPIKVAATFPINDPPLNVPVVETVSEFGYIDANGNGVGAIEKTVITSRKETLEETKARLSDPNRIIKRRAKRK